MTNETNVADQKRTIEFLSHKAFQGQVAFLGCLASAVSLNEEIEPACDRCRAPSYVYFIGAQTGPIKIGLAKKPYERLLTLQTANPEQLFIYAQVPGDVHRERQLHTRFSKSRRFGEWFNRTEELLLYIIELQLNEACVRGSKLTK